MSYALRARYTAEDVQMLTAVAAAIVHQVLQRHCQDALSIKWVNDIYRGGRKIAGILCERVDDANGYYIVVGVGVNVTPCEVPDDLKDVIGFLGDDVSTDSLAAELATELDSALAGKTSDISELSDYLTYYKSKCINLPDDIDI